MSLKFLSTISDFADKIASNDISITTLSGNIVIKSTTDPHEINAAINSGRYIDGHTTIVSTDGNLNLVLDSDFKGNVKLETRNGKISVDNFQGPKLAIKNSNGSIKVYNCIAEDLIIKSANGKVKMENIVAKKTMVNCSNGSINIENALFVNGDVDNKNGSINIEECASSELLALRNDKGNIKGKNTAARHYLAHTKNGNINLDRTTFDESDFESIKGNITVSIVKSGKTNNIEAHSGKTNITYVKSR